MKIINNILKILIVSLFLFSCSGGLEGFKFKRKSTSGDEFLIEKKDPLVLPPDFSKLPNPEEDIQKTEEEESQIDIVFKNDKSENDENQNINTSSAGLEESILKKIQKP
tara:strand:+ start:317 stop:643 length:327 start_codon:yes stop_codon:yes gene_type:complete